MRNHKTTFHYNCSSYVSHARKTYRTMRSTPLLQLETPKPVSATRTHDLVFLLKQCKTLKTLKCAHARILRTTQLNLKVFVATNLITKYASFGSINYAFALFSTSETTDAFLCNVLIRGLTDNGHHDRAINLYRRMRDLGVGPDNFSFPFVLKACASLKDVEIGREIHDDVFRFGFQSDVFVCNSLVAMYGKCGCFDLAQKVFDEMPERNVVSWSAIIGAYSQNGCFERGISIFFRMLEEEKIRPNRVTILNVIPCVRRLSEAEKIYGVVVEEGLDSDICVLNAAIGVFSRCGRIDIARRLFDGLFEKDLVSWSSMIEAYVQADLPTEALEIFKEMKLGRIHPDYVTALGVIRACSNLGSLRKTRFVHGFITRSLLEHKLVLETAVVDLYVKCGSLGTARKVFDTMHERNLVSWSTMISGYGIHGRGKDALELFDQMKGSMRPDQIVFISVLSACSHSGLIKEGWQCFNSMIADFGIMPRTEHYACMVDLLGRAGQLTEAWEFIKRMPIEPDSRVWGSLLGACRIHSNVELAEVAAKSLFELDPENSGRYILLSNIYTSSGNREEANRIRALMKQRGVKKIAGHTVIEVKNKAYKFLVGDRLNPQTDLIYKELERLMDRIKGEGYVPDTNFALHDVEEETKEKMLYVHSEKLAIVFGILNSEPGSEIQIKKNLRVCGDCHTATKFISKVTGREIVVRDSHRFHHFSRGACSCGDYW